MTEKLEGDSADENEENGGLRQWGYLNKRNCSDGGKKAKNCRWQTFWTELCGKTLRFFRDDSLSQQSYKKLPPRTLVDSNSARLKLAGFRTLHKLVIKLDYAHERDHVFQLSLGDGSMMLFQAPSEASMLKWVAALNDVSEAGVVDSDAAIEDVTAIILKQLEAEKRRRRISVRKLSHQLTFEDDDMFDVDSLTDPRLVCLRQQLRQREELLRQLEEQEKAFTDQERRVTGPKAFTRVQFIATASQGYYLIPGYQHSLINQGARLFVFGRLPNGRWRCQVDRKGFADVYCDADGKPGLTIEIKDNPLREWSRLSVVSEPGGVSAMPPVFEKRPLGVTKSNSLPSFSSDALKQARAARQSVSSRKDTDIDSSCTHTIVESSSETVDSVFGETTTEETAQLADNKNEEDGSVATVAYNTVEEDKAMVAASIPSEVSLSPGDGGHRLSTQASKTSLTDDDLIRKSNLKSNRLSAVDIGRMFSGLEVKLQQNDGASWPSASPYDQIHTDVSDQSKKGEGGVEVLAMQGLFTVKEKTKKEQPDKMKVETETEESQSSSRHSMADTSNEGIEDDRTGYTGTYTIYQSVVRKTFPLIGSVPSGLLWELQQAAESSEPPPALESLSSPDLSPAPSPITSPLVHKRSRKPPGLKLFSSPALKKSLGSEDHRELTKRATVSNTSDLRSSSAFKRFSTGSPPQSPSGKSDRAATLPPQMDTIIEANRSLRSSPLVPRHPFSPPLARSSVASSWSSDDGSSASNCYSWSPNSKHRSASPSLPRRIAGSFDLAGRQSPKLGRRLSDPTVDGRKSPRVVMRQTSEISRRGFEIRRKIRSRGISLIVGSSSSSSSSGEDSDAESSARMPPIPLEDETTLTDESGVPKNQANRRVSRPRAQYTMTSIDRGMVMNSPKMQGILASKRKRSSLPRNMTGAVRDEMEGQPQSPSSDGGGSVPTKGFMNFFSNFKLKKRGSKDKVTVRKPRSHTLPPEWSSSSSRSPTPDVCHLFSPVVNPPMNSRRAVLLEKTDEGYGFKLETYGWVSASGEQKKQTFVVAVEEDMPAFSSGLKAGDAILEVDGEDMENAGHDEVVAKLRSVTGPVRFAVVFVDGVKRLRLQQQLNALKKQLKSKQRELWALIQREMIVSGDVGSDEEESDDEQQ